MNNSEEEQQAWLKETLGELDQQQENIDYVTRSRLSAGRAQAIEKLRAQRASQWRFFNPGIAVFAMVVVVTTAVLFNPLSKQQSSLPGELPTQDLPILASSEELDFFQQLEMLEWMDESDSGFDRSS